MVATFKRALVTRVQRATDEGFGTALVKQPMREAAPPPAGPRGDALLDVFRQLSQVVPKLNDSSGWTLLVAIIAW